MKQGGFAHILIMVVLASFILATVILVKEQTSFNQTAPNVGSIVTKAIPISIPVMANSPSTLPILDSSPLPANPTVSSFSDSDLGFKLSFPSGYQLILDNEQNYFQRHFTDFRKNFTQTYGYAPPSFLKGYILQSSNVGDLDSSPFTLWVFDNPENLSPGRWYENYWYYPFVWGEYEPTKSLEGPDDESSISGVLANYRTIAYQPLEPTFYYLQYKGKMFLFRIQGAYGPGILKLFTLTK